jgi:hypothetical protein
MREADNHCPPKAEVTGSNPVGCANNFNRLDGSDAERDKPPSAECPHYVENQRFPQTKTAAQAGPLNGGASDIEALLSQEMASTMRRRRQRAPRIGTLKIVGIARPVVRTLTAMFGHVRPVGAGGHPRDRGRERSRLMSAALFDQMLVGNFDVPARRIDDAAGPI